jgi:thiamine biosynthesis lipoprotein
MAPPILFAAFLLLLASCSTPPKQPPLTRYEFEEPQMGVPFKIILYAATEQQATNAADAAYARVAKLNAILSDYEYDSELSQLGRASGSGRAVPVSDELWTVLMQSQKIARASDGAFDITIAPVIQLWRKARREKKLPAPEAIAAARARVGYTNLILKNHTAELKLPNMRLDVGGIAKGYAADEGMKALRAHGIQRALVAASSDMVFSDPPPHKPGWKIEIPNYDDPVERRAPRVESPSISTNYLLLKNCALSTSGDIFQFVEIDGKRYSHVVDPKTGYGLTDRSLATVIAKNGLTADSLETTISLLGPERGLQLARQFHVEARASHQLPNGIREEKTTPNFWRHREKNSP